MFKRIAQLALVLCLAAGLCLGAHTEFYVTKGGSSADNNGGSTGDNDGAPIHTNDNCSTNGDGTEITNDESTGWETTAADDWLCWDTAGTKEFARVTGVAGDVLTVTPGVTGSQAGKTVNVGGAWATIDHAARTVATTLINAASDPPRCNIGLGTYSEQFQIANSGTAAIPLTFEGYEAAPGDGCPSGTLPLVSSAGAGLAAGCYAAAGKDYLRVAWLNIEMSGAGIEAVNHLSDNSVFEHLHLKATGAGAVGYLSNGSSTYAIDIYVEDSAAYGLQLAGTYDTAIGCVSASAGTTGMAISTGCSAIGCVVDTPANDGIYMYNGGSRAINCTVYGAIAGSGVIVSGTNGRNVIGCIFVNNNQYGIENNGAAYAMVEDYNAFFGNGVAETLSIVRRGANDVTLTGDPFTNAAGGVFSLDNTAGEGAACRTAGFPGAMLDGLNTGYRDIGALQHEDAGGGASNLINGGLVH